jgi:hypothetical protein
MQLKFRPSSAEDAGRPQIFWASFMAHFDNDKPLSTSPNYIYNGVERSPELLERLEDSANL